MHQGKSEGLLSPYNAVNIALINASLIVGYARGTGKNSIQISDIKAVGAKYKGLYLPLFAHFLPAKMLKKYPRYVLDHSIIPKYAGVIDLGPIRDNYFKLIELSSIPENGQLLMLNAITGIASGIALVEGRNSLTNKDIEMAKTTPCDSYPKCGVMLADGLTRFENDYPIKFKVLYLPDK